MLNRYKKRTLTHLNCFWDYTSLHLIYVLQYDYNHKNTLRLTKIINLIDYIFLR